MCYAPIIMQLYNQAATCELTKAMKGGCRGFRRDFRELTKLQKHGIKEVLGRGLVHLGCFIKKRTHSNCMFVCFKGGMGTGIF